jgi:hypothetical protein
MDKCSRKITRTIIGMDKCSGKITRIIIGITKCSGRSHISSLAYMGLLTLCSDSMQAAKLAIHDINDLAQLQKTRRSTLT